MKNVNESPVSCIGSVMFKVDYGGYMVEIVAIVSPDREEEVALSWKTLQGFRLIPKASHA